MEDFRKVVFSTEIVNDSTFCSRKGLLCLEL